MFRKALNLPFPVLTICGIEKTSNYSIFSWSLLRIMLLTHKTILSLKLETNALYLSSGRRSTSALCLRNAFKINLVRKYYDVVKDNLLTFATGDATKLHFRFVHSDDFLFLCSWRCCFAPPFFYVKACLHLFVSGWKQIVQSRLLLDFLNAFALKIRNPSLLVHQLRCYAAI